MSATATYSISDIEKISGIKAHTLRIWEKRFGILKPERTATNIRYYSSESLREVLNVGFLNRHGFKISHIAKMPAPEIAEKISSINIVQSGENDHIENLVIAMIDLDEARFQQIFSASVLRLGFENTVLQIIFPFFKRIGIMWQVGAVNPAQEHFVSNFVRQKLHVAIDSLSLPSSATSKKALLFLPENELHELSLLFYNYVLRARGIKTIYLGQSVPLDNLMRVHEIVKPDFMVTVSTNEIAVKEFEGFVKILSGISPRKKVLVSGKVAIDYKKQYPSNVKVFKDVGELVGYATSRG